MFIPHEFRLPAWLPALSDGSPTMEVDVDQHDLAEVSVVPQSEYVETFEDFMVGFALRVERVDDASQSVISDIVTVQGGVRDRLFRNASYPEGSVLFRF